MSEFLDNIKIASPCPMAWSDMELTETERARFCGQCKKNVYDIASMSTSEAELFLQHVAMTSGSVCLQIYRRADGTVITDDCPVGLRRVRDFWRKVKTSAAAFFALAFTQGAAQAGDSPACKVERTAGFAPIQQIRGESSAPMNWEARAMAIPKLNAMIEKIKAAEAKTPNPTSEGDKLSRAKMYMELAKASDANKLPLYAFEQYQKADNTAQGLKKNKAFVKELLEARMKNNSAFGRDNSELQKRLDALK